MPWKCCASSTVLESQRGFRRLVHRSCGLPWSRKMCCLCLREPAKGLDCHTEEAVPAVWQNCVCHMDFRHSALSTTSAFAKAAAGDFVASCSFHSDALPAPWYLPVPALPLPPGPSLYFPGWSHSPTFLPAAFAGVANTVLLSSFDFSRKTKIKIKMKKKQKTKNWYPAAPRWLPSRFPALDAEK